MEFVNVIRHGYVILGAGQIREAHGDTTHHHSLPEATGIHTFTSRHPILAARPPGQGTPPFKGEAVPLPGVF